jgi:Ran GTPase-activating protein (RanGAP) involved in mRNA processing and transport
MKELGRNTIVTSLTICHSASSLENAQQLKAMLRRNTTLECLILRDHRQQSAALAEIASALYRNTSIKVLDISDIGLTDTESANVLRDLMRHNKTITSLILDMNAFGSNVTAVRSMADGVRSNTILQYVALESCGMDDQGISALAGCLGFRGSSLLELGLCGNKITSVGVPALVAMNTVTKLNLSRNPIGSEGTTILADALGHNAMPSLKRLILDGCGIDDEGFVALVSSLERNESLRLLSLEENDIGEGGFLALAESLPNIKGLQRIDFTANASFQSILPMLLEGFRKNMSLFEVNIAGCKPGAWLQEMKSLGQRNSLTPLLQASDPLADLVPSTGESSGGPTKRRRDDV